MMFTKRTETVDFKAFMKNEYKDTRKEKKPSKRLYVPLTVSLIGVNGTAHAETIMVEQPAPVEAVPANGEVMDKIAHAFDPLIDLMVQISLPIAGVMLTGGALLIMIGQKDQGYKLIFNAALGYVLVQMSPLFISMLSGVGDAI